MRENPRVRRLGRAEPLNQLSEELGVSSALLASLLADAARVAAAEHRAWMTHERGRRAGAGRCEGVSVEERVSLLG